MLPSELLVSRSYKGKIKPVFSPVAGKQLKIAEWLIDTFSSFVGKKKGDLMDALAYEYKDTSNFDYRFIRGLVRLLERRCTFEVRSVVDPIDARRLVFNEASKTLVSDDAERKKVLDSVSSILHISIDELEESLWADYEEELILADFMQIEPVDLLKLYNLSLAQTLLFKAMNMEFTINSNYQRIFGRLKYLGLMYSISIPTSDLESDSGFDSNSNFYSIYVDGPFSLFKLTKKYGTSFAKLLPVIMTADEWKMSADIVRETENGPKILKFHLDSEDRDKFPDVGKTDGKEWLLYKTFPIDVALVRGTTGNMNGDITMEKEGVRLEMLPMAMAAKNSGGIVIAQVERISIRDFKPMDVVIPGILVDYVVVAPPNQHMQSFAEQYNPGYSGEIVVPTESVKELSMGAHKIIGRRGAIELKPNSIVNIGIGSFPEAIASVAGEEGIFNLFTLTVESGPVGGIPAGGLSFGLSLNPMAIIDQPYMFDFYDGGGLDLAFMGFAQCDINGNVNVSKIGPRIPGIGGFINITQNAEKVVFCGTFSTKGLKEDVRNGKLVIVEEE